MKKIVKTFGIFLGLFTLLLIFVTVVKAIDTGSVTATVTAQNISLSITANPTFDYGTLAVGTTENTVHLAKTATASNDGNIAEKFNIQGANTTGCVWTLDSTIGTANHYVHGFSTTGGVPYTALTAGYQVLAASVASSGTKNFDLQITVPSSSSCYTTATAVVTVQATLP